MKKRYSSSLTDTQWKYVENKLPQEMLKRKRKWALRLLFDAILYVLKNGIVWDDLPKDLPRTTPYIITSKLGETAVFSSC